MIDINNSTDDIVLKQQLDELLKRKILETDGYGDW